MATERGAEVLKRSLPWLGFATALSLFFAYWYKRTHPDLPPPPTPAEIQALSKRRDELSEELRNAIVASGEKGLARAPRAGVMIGMPTSFTRSLADQIVTGLFKETTIVLQRIKVHKEDDVQAKMLFGKRKVGEFVLDLNLEHAEARIRPSAPTLAFEPGRIAVSLPYELLEGTGQAHLDFAWDSSTLAGNMICGDVKVSKDVDGSVRPESYEGHGAFAISTEGGALVLRPEFPDLRVRIFVLPSEKSWKVVDDVIESQKGMCTSILKKIDLKAILAKLLDKGINIKIPEKIFKPIRLPAGLSQSLEVHGIQLGLEIKPTAFIVSHEKLWYGADVKTQARGPKPAAPTH